MPNWCSNRLRVSAANVADLSAFYSRLQQNDVMFSFEWFIPSPQELSDINTGHNHINGVSCTHWRRGPVPHSNFPADIALTESEVADLRALYGHADTISWRIAHWGTKWDATTHSVGRGDHVLDIHFDTAWSPPHAFVKTVSRQFPALTFLLAYSEMGCGFWGLQEYVAGEVERDDSHADDMFQDRPDDVSEEEWDNADIEDKLNEEYRGFIALHGLHHGG